MKNSIKTILVVAIIVCLFGFQTPAKKTFCFVSKSNYEAASQINKLAVSGYRVVSVTSQAMSHSIAFSSSGYIHNERHIEGTILIVMEK